MRNQPNLPQFIGYEDTRDVIFVLGAGASYSDNIPLQADILEKIFHSTDQELRESKSAVALRNFISENFYINDKTFPTLETVFGFLDHFISRNENLSGKYTSEVISKLKNALIKIIHYSIATSGGRRSDTYDMFWKIIGNRNRNVSLISMNYDTLAEDSFGQLFSKNTYIDYCTDLMNYHDYEQLHPFDWWINPREPVTTWSSEKPKSIKLLKIHGSLTWKYCKCCGQVLLTILENKIDLNSMGFLNYEFKNSGYPGERVTEFVCPIDQSPFDTLIIPPTHLKELTHPIISRLLDESALEIRKAKSIVFVGYSFPESDVHIKALLRKNIQPSTEIHVVGPSLDSQLTANYRCLSKNVNFHEQTFADFVEQDLDNLLIKYQPRRD